MAEKSVPNEPVAIDPMFFIPDGAVELVYTDGTIDRDDSASFDPLFEGGLSGDQYGDIDGRPLTPSIIGVVTQTIRRSDDGSLVVDVILDVEDVAGAINYEARVTKI